VKCADDGVVIISLAFAGFSFAVVTSINGDGDETHVREFAAEREHIVFAAAGAVKGDDDGTATGKICGRHQNSRHAITRVGSEGKMKFRNRVRRRQFLKLRRERDARTVNELEKIGARISVRAARDQKQQPRQWEKTLHADIFRNAAGMTSF
jgi:hypothetical protein